LGEMTEQLMKKKIAMIVCDFLQQKQTIKMLGRSFMSPQLNKTLSMGSGSEVWGDKHRGMQNLCKDWHGLHESSYCYFNQSLRYMGIC